MKSLEHSKENYTKNYKTIGRGLKDFLDNLLISPAAEKIAELTKNVNMDFPSLLRSIILADSLKCVEKAVQNSCSIKEMECFQFILYTFFEEQNLSFDQWLKDAELAVAIPNMLNSLREAFPYETDTFGVFQLVRLLSDCGYNDIANEYFIWMYELAQCATYADGRVSKLESVWMELLDFYRPIILSRARVSELARESSTSSSDVEYYDDYEENEEYYNNDVSVTEEEFDSKDSYEESDEGDPLQTLSELIGLIPVKSDVSSLRNLLKMQQLRASKGLKAAKVSYHCVFTGNPGTGKTTVARILARIYKNLGILERGHLVETDRSGLVADYVGQTATKTNAIIDKALDGVLFIDEAYALAQGGENDFGKEAISTLLKRMEDDRKRLVVILAGYTKEMEEFINTNSGLQSRFSRYISFPDYEVDELCDIFRLFLKQNDYIIADEAMQKVEATILDAFSHKDSKFGNARFVRNLFEKVITNQANRLALKNDISKKDLALIIEDDI